MFPRQVLPGFGQSDLTQSPEIACNRAAQASSSAESDRKSPPGDRAKE
jgi:hypothetical protein